MAVSNLAIRHDWGDAKLRSVASESNDLRDLVARIRSGDRRAEESFVERFARGVSVILRKHTRNGPEAEDLFQETFRLALEKLRRGELRVAEKLPGFLSALARNLAIDHYRTIARRRTDTGNESTIERLAEGASQLGQMVRHEHAALVRRLLGDMAVERDREVLLRYYIAEEDRGHIAADLGLSASQFKKVLYRARQRYRELYLGHLAHGDATLDAPMCNVQVESLNVLLVLLAASW